jgi:hypothetical protein
MLLRGTVFMVACGFVWVVSGVSFNFMPAFVLYGMPSG